MGHAKREYLPLSQGFTSFYGHYNGAIDYFEHTRDGERDWHRNEQTISESGYSTDLLAAEAVRFIRKEPDSKPWFMYLAFNAPHGPFQAKEEDLQKYSRLRPADRRAYAAMVDSMDQAIGRVLQAVDDRPDSTNTFVWFFSDNGGIPRVGSNAPWRGAKLSVYEGGTRVCAAIRWPAGGLAGGRKCKDLVGYIDVLPTVLAAAGSTAPPDTDGRDILAALRSQAPVPARSWFSYIHQAETAHASIHQLPWKLVTHGDVFQAGQGPAKDQELYNLETDPGETNNLAAAHPEIVERLQQKLSDFGKLQRVGVTSYEEGRKGFRAPKDWIVQ